MKILFLIFCLFMIGGCRPLQSKSADLEEAEMKIYHEWLYAFKFQSFKPYDEIISRPPGIEQLILRLVIPIEGGAKLKTHCVYFQVPYKKIIGRLKIIELKNEAECSEVPSEENWLILDHLSNLLMKLENFKLTLNFDLNHQKINWTFLLPNIADGVIHEKYQAVKERKLYSGLTFLRTNEESFDLSHGKYLGKLSDRMSTSTAIRCQQINQKCQLVGENRCDDCAYGWYQVVDYNCPQGGSKFCGQNHCGEKNEPACLRGTKLGEGTQTGICQSDLSPVFNANHILVCQ
jgi:hypothetical protein